MNLKLLHDEINFCVRMYGDLAGADSTRLNIDEDGRSDQEAHVKTYSYFSGKSTHGFFQKDEKGTGLKCWYKKGTNLLVKKFVLTKGSPEQEEEDDDSGIKKRHFYDYNEGSMAGVSLGGIGHSEVDFILNNPRFHGTLQALGGLAEASFGGGMTLATYGAAAPFGWPVMAHGLDQFITGISTAFTGRPRDTLTSQLLQKTGP